MLKIPFVIAHRGASEYAPENTAAAITLAKTLGASFVEVDLHLTLDNKVVIIHDETVNKCTNGKGLVDHFTLAELQTLDAGSWFSIQFAGEKLLSLEELIRLLTALDLQVNLELKPLAHTEDKLVEETIAIVKKTWPAHKPLPLFSSFSLTALEKVKSLWQDTPLAALFEKWNQEALTFTKSLKPLSVNLSKRHLNSETVSVVKEISPFVMVYTVNDPEEARRLRDMGVDAIFTNCPDKMLAIL